MSKTAVARLLSDTDKGIAQTSGTDGMLARIFREFLVSYRLSFDQWERLIREYIKEIATEEQEAAVENGVLDYEQDKEHLTSLRTNLRNALAEKTMTWPTFIKGIRFFRSRKFDIDVKGCQSGTEKEISASLTIYVNEAERKAHKAEFADICLNVMMGKLLHAANVGKMEGALWESYMDTYIKREIAADAEDSGTASSIKTTIGSLRTNLKKNLSRESMTWRTFVTGLRFLQLSTAHITVTIHPAGKPAMVQELIISIDEDYSRDE